MKIQWIFHHNPDLILYGEDGMDAVALESAKLPHVGIKEGAMKQMFEQMSGAHGGMQKMMDDMLESCRKTREACQAAADQEENNAAVGAWKQAVVQAEEALQAGEELTERNADALLDRAKLLMDQLKRTLEADPAVRAAIFLYEPTILESGGEHITLAELQERVAAASAAAQLQTEALGLARLCRTLKTHRVRVHDPRKAADRRRPGIWR